MARYSDLYKHKNLLICFGPNDDKNVSTNDLCVCRSSEVWRGGAEFVEN
jgi:hypothetical protein